MSRHPTALLAPAVGAGVLMAAYLMLRPYGDATDPTTTAAAEAFASGRWVAAHVCGALAIASFARLALRVSDLAGTTTARLARWTGLAGTTLALPYYGAETFGLHAVGARALAGDDAALELVGPIRDQPVAFTMFGLGLVLLAVSGITTALAWQRARLTRPAWAAWPIGVLTALLAAQFYLPPVGRTAFGVVYAIAAAVAVAGVLTTAARRADGDGDVDADLTSGRAGASTVR